MLTCLSCSRSTCVTPALAYNLAAIFGGAFAPAIAQALVNSKFGVAGVGWYMAIMAALALLALFLIKESKDKDYEL